MYKSIFAVVALLGFCIAPAVAQTQSPLVGVWERISFKNGKGVMRQPPLPSARVIFSADGYFSQTAVPAKRPKIDTRVSELNRDELVDRFNYLSARFGKYEVSGNRLTRTEASHSNPNLEGRVITHEFGIDGDVMTLTISGTQFETKWQRLK